MWVRRRIGGDVEGMVVDCVWKAGAVVVVGRVWLWEGRLRMWMVLRGSVEALRG